MSKVERKYQVELLHEDGRVTTEIMSVFENIIEG